MSGLEAGTATYSGTLGAGTGLFNISEKLRKMRKVSTSETGDSGRLYASLFSAFSAFLSKSELFSKSKRIKESLIERLKDLKKRLKDSSDIQDLKT